MERVRVGIVGLGMMGQQHIDAVRRIPGVEVVALSDSNEKSLLRNAEQLGIEKTYTDYKMMIDNENLQVVHNCTPNAMHFEVSKYAIEKGCHIYCEKPLAVSWDEAEELVRLAEEHHVVNGVNFNYRNNVMVREIRERIVTGDAGRIYLFHGRYLQDWLMYDTDYSWRLNPEINGQSRAVADIGSHWFDLAECVLDSKIVKVYAKLLTVIPKRKKPKEAVETFAEHHNNDYEEIDISNEDAGTILVQMENGAFGTLILSQVSGGCKNDLAITVDCENYSLRWEQENADKLWIASRKEGTKLVFASPNTVNGEAKRYASLPEGHAVAWKDALYNGIRDFYGAIQNKECARKTKQYAKFGDGAHIINIVNACMESNRKNEWVDVE